MGLLRPPKPDIGELRTRAKLQSKASAAAGGAGGTGMTETYATIGHAWCAIQLLRGGRYVAGQQTEEVATHRIIMRHRDDYTLWRYVLVGSRRFRVLSIGDPDDRHQWLVAECEEMTP